MNLRPVIVPIGPSIAYVELTQRQYALIDSEDAERVGKHNWHTAWNGTSSHFYARRRYLCGENKSNRHFFLHEFILGKLENHTADHIFSERTLDNRKCNLRQATENHQAWNRRIPSNNTSGFRGIYFDPKKKLWRAIIVHRYKRIGLGRFKSKTDAILAYDRAAIDLRGDLAKPNFPGGVLSKVR